MNSPIALPSLWQTLRQYLARISEPKILLLWFLSGAVLAILLGHEPELRLILTSTGGQIRLIEPGPRIERADFDTQKILAGDRSVSFSVSKTSKRQLTLEFSSFETPPKISNIELRFLGVKSDLKITAIEPLQSEAQTSNIVTLNLPALFTATCITMWMIIAGLATTMLMLWPRRIEGQERSTVLAMAWLVLCFSIFTYQVIWSSIQLPWMDDWRYYSDGPFSLINRQLHWITISGNDTYFFTGQAIDWILLGLFNGSFLPVRFFGLVALAGFLSFAAALILHFCKRFSTIAVVFLSFSISSSGYWGHTGIAYHQMLPVLFFVWSLWQLTKIGPHETSKSVQRLVLASLALGAGLAYISGPLLFIAVAIASTTVFILQRFQSSQHSRNTDHKITDHWAIPVGILSLIGVLTMLLQLSVVISRQGSLLEHSHASATVLPIETRFWWFMGGLFGRITGIHGPSIGVDILILTLFLLSLLSLAFFAIKKPTDTRQRQMLLIAISIGVGLLLYTAMVSAGRAGLAGADSASWANVSALAKTRFHYWWIAALFPIYIAIFLELISPGSKWQQLITTPFLIALFLLKSSLIIGEDAQSFEMAKRREQQGIDCLRIKWTESRLNRKTSFNCPDFYPGPMNQFLKPMIVRNLNPAMEIFQYQPNPGK